ncbi:MAG: diphthamide synthesis protein [Nanoarchaeota archaeon]
MQPIKRVYVDVDFDKRIRIPASFIRSLPKRVVLFTTIQYVKQIDAIKAQLALKGVKVDIVKTRHTAHPGQIYGCNIEPLRTRCDAFVFVGDGLFHPNALLIGNDKKVFMYSPETRQSKVISRKDIDRMEKRRMAAYGRFLQSTHVGVLVSLKSGQNFMHKALSLKEAFPQKRFYFLVSDEIDLARLEDWPFIEVFINTACPRIGFDDTHRMPKPLIDISSVPGFKNQ